MTLTVLNVLIECNNLYFLLATNQPIVTFTNDTVQHPRRATTQMSVSVLSPGVILLTNNATNYETDKQ